MNIFDVYIQVENYFYDDVVIFTSDITPSRSYNFLFECDFSNRCMIMFFSETKLNGIVQCIPWRAPQSTVNY